MSIKVVHTADVHIKVCPITRLLSITDWQIWITKKCTRTSNGRLLTASMILISVKEIWERVRGI